MKKILVVLLLFLLNPTVNGNLSDISLQISEFESPFEEVTDVQFNFEPDQEPVITFRDLFNGAINIIEKRRIDSGTGNLISFSEDPVVYYGLAGGLAGIGKKLLETRIKNQNLISTETSTKLLNIAQQIGFTINETATQNSTNFEIPVHNGTNQIDLSWDFGLSGLASFFSLLYNQTKIISYLETSEKIIQTLYDLANKTSGIHFETNLHNNLTNSWYPDIDFLPYLGKKITFNGISLGAAGLTKASLDFLKYTNSTNKMTANLLLNGSLKWINNQLEVDNSELSLKIAADPFQFKSTSLATGVSGIADLYLDLYSYTNNDTYLQNSIAMFNWLQGNNTKTPRYLRTWEQNGTMMPDLIEFGVTHGTAGISKYLMKLNTIFPHSNVTNSLITVTRHLASIGSQSIDGSEVKYGERTVGAGTVLLGSTSWAYGSGGIFEVLFEVGDYLKDAQIKGKAFKTKSYLTSQYMEENKEFAIKTFRTLLLENNPSIGYIGSLSYLYELLPGKIEVQTSKVNFGEIEQFLIATEFISIKNSGEENIAPSWNNLQDSVFSTSNFSTVIPGGVTKQVPVQFTASNEVAYEEFLTIVYQSTNVNVTLSASSFDKPDLDIIEGLSESTQLNSKEAIYFEVQATDLSGVARVNFGVNGSVSQMKPIIGTNRYNLSWVPNLENGTYPLVITAEDILDHANSIEFFVTMSVYTTPIVEQLLGKKTQFILIGIAAIFIVIAIIVTRRYMRQS